MRDCIILENNVTEFVITTTYLDQISKEAPPTISLLREALVVNVIYKDEFFLFFFYSISLNFIY